jgi:hypothetical protein
MAQGLSTLVLEQDKSTCAAFTVGNNQEPNRPILTTDGSVPLEVKGISAQGLMEDQFEPSQAHRVWRMMQALIEVHPDWTDMQVFERARGKMITFGLSMGLSLEDLFSMCDPETIQSLWKATVAAENDLWE